MDGKRRKRILKNRKVLDFSLDFDIRYLGNHTDSKSVVIMKLCDGARGMYEKLILAAVQNERDSQQIKWGIQIHSIPEWLTILGEEYGEACKAGLETEFNKEPLKNLEKELIQVMAVSLAILEGISMNHTDSKSVVIMKLCDGARGI